MKNEVLDKKHDRSYSFAMSKGESTRAAILDAALAQASEGGFESLTIGSLAERAGMSKSGLFAHFGSREELQVAAIEQCAALFTQSVFLPALKARRGLPRIPRAVRRLARLDASQRIEPWLPDAGGGGGVRRSPRARSRCGGRAFRAPRARAWPRGAIGPSSRVTSDPTSTSASSCST
jgi:AcrR family transcriptional regulator